MDYDSTFITFYEKFIKLNNTIYELDEYVKNNHNNIVKIQDSYNKEKSTKLKKLNEEVNQISIYLNIAKSELDDKHHIKPKTNPVPYDPEKLKNLALLIGSDSDNSERAIELFTLATSNIAYIETQSKNIKKVYEDKIRSLSIKENQSLLMYKKKKAGIYSNIDRLFHTHDSIILARTIQSINNNYLKNVTEFKNVSVEPDSLYVGAVLMPMDAYGTNEYIKKIYGKSYDIVHKCIRYPYGLNLVRPQHIAIIYENYQTTLNKIQGLMFNCLNQTMYCSNRCFFLDPITYEPKRLTLMNEFTHFNNGSTDEKYNAFLYPIATNSKELFDSLKRLLLLGKENIGSDTKKHRFLYIHSPKNLDSNSKDIFNKIVANHKEYCISIIEIIEEATSDRLSNANIYDKTIIEKDKKWYLDSKRFIWYPTQKSISSNYIDSVNKVYAPKIKTDRYFEYFDEKPQYTKRNRNIEILLGIENHKPYFYKMDDSHHFGFLMGTAGAGKSTLYGSLIYHLITHYHPDDLELWLIDFDGSTFRDYMYFDIPHVKYILVDNSISLMKSFVDQMMKEYQRRKRYFSKINERLQAMGQETIWQWNKLPNSVYMPSILIIIDEFEVMSKLLDDDSRIKKSISDILALTRKYGFHVIFGSQSFGDDSTKLLSSSQSSAKANINMGLIMKSQEEDTIYQLLDVKKNDLSESEINKVKRIKDTEHVVIVKEKGNRIAWINTVYFDDKDKIKRNGILKNMGDRLSRSNCSYTKKRTITYDGKRETIYDKKITDFKKCVSLYWKTRKTHFIGNECFFIGDPRSFNEEIPILIKQDFNENILISGDDEITSDTIISIILSLYKSANLVNWNSEILGTDYSQTSYELKNIGLNYVDPAKTKKTINKIYEEYMNGVSQPHLIIIPYAERTLNDLYEIDDEQSKDFSNLFSFSSEKNNSRIQEISTKNKLMELLKKGPQKGIHFVLHISDYKNIEKVLKIDLFKHLILTDTETIVSEYIGGFRSKDRELIRQLSKKEFLYLYGNERHLFKRYIHQNFKEDK